MKNIIVETTSRCNLSCSMCLRHSWKESEGDMDLDVFRSILSSSSKPDSLSLSGYGEPFLHPHLVDMIRMARERLPNHSRIHLTSNGTLPDRGVLQDAIQAGLNGIAISVDSLQADQFQLIRGGASLSTVTETLEHFAALRERLPFSFEFSTVVMERNIQELPDLVGFAAEHGVERIWVNNVLPYTEKIAAETLYDSPSEDVLELFRRTRGRLRDLGADPGSLLGLVKKLFSLRGAPTFVPSGTLSPAEDLVLGLARELASVSLSMGGIRDMLLRVFERDEARWLRSAEIFRKSDEIAARHHIELHLPLLVPKTQRECNFVKTETCFITWQGWVRPCNQLSHDYDCFHYGRPRAVKSVSFGKIPEESLESVWNSQAYTEFRKKVAEFPFSPCGDCGLADGCGYVAPDRDFLCDCNMCEQPCGDCLWSRGILQCP